MGNRKWDERFKGKSKEMAIIKKSINLFLNKYGYEMLNCVVTRILQQYRAQRNLEKEIKQAEEELEKLKRKKI